MTFPSQHLALFLLCVFAFFPAQGQATEEGRNAQFQRFLASLKVEMQAAGLNPEHFTAAIGGDFSIDEKAIEKLGKQPESTMTFSQYTNALVSQSRVQEGQKRLQQHHKTLQQISRDYGPPPEVMVALWGVETFYGKWAGRHNIARSLATLAFDSHRKEFFKKELFAAMRILKEGHIPPQGLQGSWAGAMGQCQFMPTSFLAYSADGNGDGKKDIWTQEADVFASTANYLKKNGWKNGQPWGQRVVLSKILPPVRFSERGLSGHKTVTEWAALGVTPVSAKQPLPEGGAKARLFLPMGPSGVAHLVYDNFDTILDWNRSSFFAFSVLTLAEKIAEGAL